MYENVCHGRVQVSEWLYLALVYRVFGPERRFPSQDRLHSPELPLVLYYLQSWSASILVLPLYSTRQEVRWLHQDDHLSCPFVLRAVPSEQRDVRLSLLHGTRHRQQRAFQYQHNERARHTDLACTPMGF